MPAFTDQTLATQEVNLPDSDTGNPAASHLIAAALGLTSCDTAAPAAKCTLPAALVATA